MIFTHDSGIVSGERFVGRSSELRRLDNRVIRQDRPNPIAVVGLPGVGKSSLCWQATQERKEELLRSGRLPVWINVGDHATPRGVFVEMAVSVLRSLSESGRMVGRLETMLKALRSAHDDEFSGYLKEYFIEVRREGFHPVVVLDEFDAARDTFKNSAGPFQWLRGLASTPDTRVGLILIARRSIAHIEATCGISYLERIVQYINLGPFDDNDQRIISDAFAQTVDALGAESASFWWEAMKWSGGFPYPLMNALAEARELVEEERDESRRMSNYQSFVRSFCLTWFGLLRRILNEDLLLLPKLLGMFFGPPVEFPEDERDQCAKYGLIRRIGGSLVCLSNGFTEFLEGLAFRAELWPLWSETEMLLRTYCGMRLEELFGDAWTNATTTDHNLNKVLSGIAERRDRLGRTMESRDLLDFAYPAELFQILFLKWDKFRHAFGRDRKYWNERFELLTRVRNEAAHVRPISKDEMQTAQVYCSEILKAVRGSSK